MSENKKLIKESKQIIAIGKATLEARRKKNRAKRDRKKQK